MKIVFKNEIQPTIRRLQRRQPRIPDAHPLCSSTVNTEEEHTSSPNALLVFGKAVAPETK